MPEQLIAVFKAGKVVALYTIEEYLNSTVVYFADKTCEHVTACKI